MLHGKPLSPASQQLRSSSPQWGRTAWRVGPTAYVHSTATSVRRGAWSTHTQCAKIAIPGACRLRDSM